jgi:hypothetical protein
MGIHLSIRRYFYSQVDFYYGIGATQVNEVRGKRLEGRETHTLDLIFYNKLVKRVCINLQKFKKKQSSVLDAFSVGRD